MSPAQVNAYQLAENLGMTVTRMMSEMTLAEFYGWMAFYAEQNKGDQKPQKPVKGGDVVIRGFNL